MSMVSDEVGDEDEDEGVEMMEETNKLVATRTSAAGTTQARTPVPKRGVGGDAWWRPAVEDAEAEEAASSRRGGGTASSRTAVPTTGRGEGG